MWTHGPRRSHDQHRPDVKHSRSSSSDDSEPRRRTSSDATPRQTHATTKFLNSATEHDTNRNVLSGNTAGDVFNSSKRLGFFADKLSSSLSGTGKETGANLKSALHPSQLLHPHSHSRANSNNTAQDAASPSPTMASSASISGVGKSHTSPSKASYGRTYDSKLVSREMHRLGNLAHLPSALAPQLSTAPSVTSLALPASSSMSQANIASSSTTDPWGALHVHVLPLFNGEPLRIPIEDLNVLVKRHIQTVVSSAPSKALGTLEHDTSELIASGMVTLNAKLAGIDDEKLVGRVVEIWGFFWDQVLTYLEGVLLPLQTDPLLSSLYRTPKSHHRATSPTRQNNPKSSMSSTLNSSFSMSPNHIDVRTVALRSFRDRVILPLFQRLYMRLSMPNRQDSFQDTASYQQPRLQQMLLVLSSQSRQRPVTFSLTAPTPQPTAGEAAITDLLRVVRNPRPHFESSKGQAFKNSPAFQTRTPTFLSGGVPRDRRGRIAQKQKGDAPSELVGLGAYPGDEEEAYAQETPRTGPGSYVADMEREREREFLEALRSPDVESSAARASTGGWGLGAGHEPKTAEDEEEDEPLSWDQAQAVVERMVGMAPGQPETRRRMT
ncbi:HbrB-like-domain-containing protein [Crucibulum laeve]|uniref:HbrB-like-domain-containing protein n=1 Tax=Crucibulum laeve TaxID=68775 RepID=A0A5C3MJJ7_9AGAR|nr:HbrB-like-domain-containing protein [Crucibulum laeve]